MACKQFDIEMIRRHLSYDQETGHFRWKVTIPRATKAGEEAGYCCPRGYVHIRISGRIYTAHRLAYALCHGVIPDLVDHINGDKGDNRIANLRAATRSENAQNRRRANRQNRTGALGVSPCKDKYFAQIKVAGVSRNLGQFATLEEASAAYVAAKRELHPAGCL